MALFPAIAPQRSAGEAPEIKDGWSIGRIGGLTLPGKTRVTQGGVRLKVDKKNKKGSDGGNITLAGIDPQVFQIEVMVWTQTQIEQLGYVCQQVLPRPGSTPQPMAFDHPSIRHFGFPIQLQVIGASPIEKNGAMCKLTIFCQHWIKPTGKAQKATVTPTQATRNKRAEAAEKKKPSNPPPSQQSKAGAPPLDYTPG